MSTKSTIASGASDKWFLEEEMLDETTHLVVEDPGLALYTNSAGVRIELELSPEMIEAIVKAHGEKRFPHQREKEEEAP